MAKEISLDPGARIPDPPLSEDQLLEWAAELTQSLRSDHVDSVDRIETMIMSDHRTTNRPGAKASKRFFFDEYTGTLYLDTKIDGVTDWYPINNEVEYSQDGLGVNVVYSTSLPVSGVTNGYFTWDEEVWDEASYWPGSGNTITIPETRKYQVELLVNISNLALDDEIILSTIVDGVDLTNIPEAHIVWKSDGNAKKLRLSYIKEFADGEDLQFGYNAESTFDFNEMYTIITPMTESSGGGGQVIFDHGGLSGLGDDDHALYLLASDATNRATFATNWTDLTDGGETSLHSHASATICLPAGSEYQIKSTSPADTCQNMISFDSDVMIFGNTSFPMNVYGTTTEVRAETGEVTITSVAAGKDIVLSPGSGVTPGDVMIKRGDVVLDDNFGIRGIVSGGTEKLLIRMNQGSTPNNIVEIGDSGFANIVEFVTTGNIRLARYGSTVQMQENGLTWLDMLSINASDEKIFGATASGISRLKGENVYLDASAGITLTCSGSSTVSIAGGAFYMSSAIKARLPYRGSAPSSLGNGDFWMESDGLHIYYGGAEYTVAGV
jgi:hypothetical protein